MIVRGLAALFAIALGAACGTPVGASPTPAAPSPTATAAPTATNSPLPTVAPTLPPPTPTPTPAPTGYDSPRGLITVDQPRAFARVTTPLTVSGSAMLFEAAFTWRLVDLSDRELANGAGMTNAGAPARGTFSFAVTFTVTTDTYAYISILSHSARDGSVEDEARVPVILAARQR